MKKPTVDPIVKHVWVPLAPERAFRLFTAEMHTWWPLESHSLSGSATSSVEFEDRTGGAITEITSDGTEHVWGHVLLWDPSGRVAFSWHPGREPSTAQRVELVFRVQDGGTAVQLTHSGWEALGETAEETRSGYDTGWDHVFGERFARAAAG